MAGEWREVTLADVSKDITVGHVGPMADEYVADGVPFLRSLNIHPFSVELGDVKKISLGFHQKLRKSALSPGDVVIVRTGTPGACAVIPAWLPEANCSDLVIVRPNKLIRPSFMSYVVNSTARQHIFAHTVGAVQQHFNVGSARTLRLMLPPIIEQDRIVDLLDSIRDKIEINKRIARTVEATTQALFRSWFVDFDPVRAKVEGRSTGLPKDLSALFPKSFSDEGLPIGWSLSAVGELFDVSGGNTPSTTVAENWGGSHSWATPKDLSGLAYPVLLDTERRITDLGLSRSTSGLLPRGSLLLSSRAPIGYMAFASQPVAINQGFAGFVRRAVSTAYAWGWCSENMPLIRASASGSTFPEISKGTLRGLPMLRPSDAILSAFEVAVSPMIDELQAAATQSHTLAALRDTLLPKLITGELRIRDAERNIAVA